jgi:hypothetical protein
LTFALEVVLRNDIKNNDIVIKERYDLFISSINDIINVISKKKTTEPATVLRWLKIADNILSGTNSPIRKKVDNYHPSVYEVFKKVEQDENANKSKSIKTTDEVIIDPPNETGVRIIGDEWLLKETLRNHTWDVLKKHGHPRPRKIKVQVRVDGEYVMISLLNNWLPPEEAADHLKMGSSFGFLNPSWRRYEGELKYPVQAEAPDFLSVMHLKLRKGFWE